MKRFLFLTVLAFVQLGFSQNKEKPITEVSQINQETEVLVDVRTPEEHEAGHLDDALNINWFDEDFAEQFKKIDKKKTIYLYCHSGGRSGKATQMLDSLGYKNVINLTGGYSAWKEK